MELISIHAHQLGQRIIEILNRNHFLFRLKGLYDGEHTGGYCCLANGKTGAALNIVGIGQIPDLKIGKYLRLASFEKPRRLAKHPTHVSGFQSRNEAQSKWPGAIRVANFIISFHGSSSHKSSWKLDEALMLVVGLELRLLSFEEADEIAKISSNEIFEKALAIYRECEE